MNLQPTILLFHKDLRLTDNLTLQAALNKEEPIIPLYIHSTEKEKYPAGSASKWWLHQSLYQLDAKLKQLGSRLILRKGDPFEILSEIISQTHAKNIYWSQGFEPCEIAKEKKLKEKLSTLDVNVKTFNSTLLFEPGRFKTKQGKPFQIFAFFWKALLQTKECNPPLAAPKQLPRVPTTILSDSLDSFNLEPSIDWTRGLKTMWQPGEEGGLIRLSHFIENYLEKYEKTRDRPDLEGVSHLSAYLHFGEISPRLVWHEVRKWMATQESAEALSSAETFLKELAWREFAYHLLYHFPHTIESPLDPAFNHFPWHDNASFFDAWTSGTTGYPIIDAGMRELWVTGWMHNRVRMIVASFLVKDLLIPWQKGSAWFWDTLVDADLANNSMNWQWVAGCGADAAPYFRIFNPVVQGEKFDPDGTYIRRWIPELAKLDNHYIHKPWKAPEIELKLADIVLGINYPLPIVEHDKARIQALKAFEKIKSSVA
ncbi:MAG: deoxyribodipyrimidine photo-lyase [Chlamydiales bacterium]|nr:deoxyribodipyrimidine photo-lyase [Chlamydiales bacterium]